MKTQAEYKREERLRKKNKGLKRIEFWIDPVNEKKIRNYINNLENNQKLSCHSLTGQII